jgi:thiosulfate dehydrogenase [quinone] large subunit
MPDKEKTMSTISRHRGSTSTTKAPQEPSQQQGLGTALGLLRLALGWVFLWAFLDKLFALGFATGRDAKTGVVDRFGDAAWVNGGSPTKGFLTFGTAGPLKDFYGSFAGAAWADWLFMLGLFGIGVALVLGVGMRIATMAGSAMLVMMWSAYLPPDNNPFMDDHLVYALALVVLLASGAGKHLGLGRAWNRLTVVRHHRWLR